MHAIRVQVSQNMIELILLLFLKIFKFKLIIIQSITLLLRFNYKVIHIIKHLFVLNYFN